jgi:uncharacterized protein YdeI (YjbR/CyaY-like superfamily)
MDRVEPKTLAEWRSWLEANHLESKEIWLVIPKVGKAGFELTMRDGVDEALCFGWIDSRGKRLDENRFMLRLTPRKSVTNWSQRNLRRAYDLIDQGRMTEAGMSKLPVDFRSSIVMTNDQVEQEEILPPELEHSMKADTNVWNSFRRLTPGRRKEFIRWVSSAKRPETRHKRIARTVELIRMGRSLTEDMTRKWSNGKSG